MKTAPNSTVNLMPIGRFSNACRLSIKALRYYDERDILKPAYVDPDNGYRYYRQDQGRDAVLIALLRSLDIPLESIRSMLTAADDDLSQYLAVERKRVETEISSKRRALDSIERLTRFGTLTPYEVSVRVAPDYRLASMQLETDAEHMLNDSSRLMDKLLGELTSRSIELVDPFMCVNGEPNAKGRMIVTAGVGCRDELHDSDRINMVTVTGGPEAWLTHRGSYQELGIAFHSVTAWAQQQGHEQRDALREIYKNDPAETDVNDLITEVVLPISL